MRGKLNGRLVAAVVVAVILGFIVNKNWGTASFFDSKNLSTFLVVGITLGGI